MLDVQNHQDEMNLVDDAGLGSAVLARLSLMISIIIFYSSGTLLVFQRVILFSCGRNIRSRLIFFTQKHYVCHAFYYFHQMSRLLLLLLKVKMVNDGKI